MSDNDKPVIGVIEWSSDSAVSPAVFVGDSVDHVRRSVVAFLAPLVAQGDVNYIDAEWRERNPVPYLGNPEAVKSWLDELREASTDAWLTIYTADDAPGEETYADLRGGHEYRPRMYPSL